MRNVTMQTAISANVQFICFSQSYWFFPRICDGEAGLLGNSGD